MEKLLKAAAVLFLCAVPALASTSNATATLTDKDGTVWANCSYTATITVLGGTSTPAPTIDGVTVSPLVVTGSCNGSGAIAATLTDTSTVDQKNVQWVFTVQSNTSALPVTVSTPVVGASPNLTQAFSLLTAPRFATGAGSYGYADGEVQGVPNLGATYYNVTTPCLRQYSLAGWTCGGGTPLPSGVTVDAEWPFNDGSGTTVTDISGNGHDATFASGVNAPSWNTYGVAFNSTGDTFPNSQYALTNIHSWKSVIIAHCVYPEIQTTALLGNEPYAVAPTIFGSSTSDGINFGGGQSVGGGQYFGAFRPNTIAVNPFSVKAAAVNGYGQCQTSALTLGASDAFYENGQPVPLFQTGTSAASVTSSGGYEFGSGSLLPFDIYRGTITYAMLSLANVWTPFQVQQLDAYIKAKIASRPLPVYPTFNQSLANQVIITGDSIFAGHAASAVWSTHLALTNTYTVNNWAIAGMNAWDLGRLAESRWYSQVSPIATRNIVVTDGGTNDLVNGWTAPQTWASLTLFAKKAIAVGALPVVSTLISRTGQDTAEAPLNALIRAGWKQAGYAALLDLAELPPFAAGGYSNTTYYQVDGTHPNGGTVCTATDGGGVLCFYTSKLVNTLDGSSVANPDVTASNAYVATDANNYVIQTPTAAATYQLVTCGAITGREKTVVNGSASFAITVSPTSPDTIVGSAVIAAGGSRTFTAVNSSPTASGCYWVAK